MSKLRIGLFAGGSLVIGFAAGWLWHRPLANAPIALAAVKSTPAIILPVPIVAPPHEQPKASLLPLAAPPLAKRLETLRWLKTIGLSSGIPVLDSKGLTHEFTTLYAMTAEETARMNQVLQRTKARLEEMARQHAQRDPTSTDDKLIVAVPAFPTESGPVYNDLLAAFASVLGADRYASFNEVLGDSINNYFDGFGTLDRQYEITLLKPNQGRQLFSIRSTFTGPATEQRGKIEGTSFSTLEAGTVGRYFPILQSFALPTAVTTPAK